MVYPFNRGSNRMKLTDNPKQGGVLLLIVMTLVVPFTSNVSGFQSPSINIISHGIITYKYSVGLSWYGLDHDSFDSFWKLNKENYDLMYSRYPNMDVLVLPFSSFSYSHADRLSRLDDLISWCKADGIKVLISNYAETYSKSGFITYWENMATRYKGNTGVLGFDLVNEPWGMKNSGWVKGWSGLIDDYEDMIDAVRAIDPERKCYVQSYLKHQEGYDWIYTNPVDRPNIAYITHIYSLDWVIGQWQTWNPWWDEYSSGDYASGYTVLHDALWTRFGKVITEEKVEFFVTETATIDDPHAKQYYMDLIEIIESWGCSWAYHSYYSGATRVCALTFPSTANERGHADLVRTCMNKGG